MERPLCPALAIIFMHSFGKLQGYANGFKLMFCKEYFDEIVWLFSSPDDTEQMKEYLSPNHPNRFFSYSNSEMVVYYF